MGRYRNEFILRGPSDQAIGQINSYLHGEGYEYTNFKGEMVYKKGHGIMSGPTFVKIETFGERVIVEAWIKFAALPGVYCGELGLDGFVGVIPKSMLQTRVQTVENILRSHGATGAMQQNFAQPAPQQPNYAPQNFAQPAPQQPNYAPQNFAQPAPQQPNYAPQNFAQPAPQQPNYPPQNFAQPAPQQPNCAPQNFAQPAPQQPNYPPQGYVPPLTQQGQMPATPDYPYWQNPNRPY